MTSDIDKLRAGGFSEDEIAAHIASNITSPQQGVAQKSPRIEKMSSELSVPETTPSSRKIIGTATPQNNGRQEMMIANNKPVLTFVDKAKERIKSEEGLRLSPYKCTAGKNTIGYGRNIDAMMPSKERASLMKGITNKKAESMLSEDVVTSIKNLHKIFGENEFNSLGENQKTVLTDMMYNLGTTKFKGSRK